MRRSERSRRDSWVTSASKIETRNWLAFGITGISIVGVILLSVTIIVVSDAGVTERAQTVLNAVLPLLGTWVGTVLAYFFSRENFESASRSVERLTRLTLQERFESMPVTSAMTPIGNMIFVKNPMGTKLLDILNELEKKEYAKRLPILDSNNRPQALVFREGIIDYLYRAQARTSEEIKDLTVQNLLDEAPRLNKPFAIVGEQDTLADAQEAMLRMPECRVVFITRSGGRNDAVIGMLTNTDFAAKVQA